MSTEAARLDKIISDYIEAIKQQGIKIEKYYLFGSHARGTADENSDIDLIVISSDFSQMPDWERWEILGKAVAKIMEPIEPLAFTPKEIETCIQRESNFIRYILNEPDTKLVQLSI